MVLERFFLFAFGLSTVICCHIPCGAKAIAPRENAITNFTQGDGFGSQFQSIIASAVYADLNGKTFLYSPFTTMEHNYDNSADFLAKKEWLINFIGNFDINIYNNLPIKNWKEFFDKNVAACAQSAMLRKIKTVFRANKKRDDYFDAQYCNIAIHIRRPNPDDSRITGADTPNKFFGAVIRELRKKYKDKNPQLHLYSQGSPNDFALFVAPDVVFHINESVEDTFIGLVLADVLVCGASSFSYSAGLLSDGVVYYIPFWHAPLPEWISTNTVVPPAVAHAYRAVVRRYFVQRALKRSMRCFSIKNLLRIVNEK